MIAKHEKNSFIESTRILVGHLIGQSDERKQAKRYKSYSDYCRVFWNVTFQGDEIFS